MFFLGGFKLQIDDICIAPAIIDLFYFILLFLMYFRVQVIFIMLQ